jgi:hypothetical protein
MKIKIHNSIFLIEISNFYSFFYHSPEAADFLTRIDDDNVEPFNMCSLLNNIGYSSI